MAAPSFVTAGSGATDTGGAWTYTGPIPAVGDLLICQILVDGTTAGLPTITSTTNIASLSGTANQWTAAPGNPYPVGSPTAANQLIFFARATSAAAPVLTGANVGSDDIYLRVYVFRNVNTGTALTDIIENGTAGATPNGVGTSNTVSDTGVTTLAADRLALQLIGFNNFLFLAAGAMTGETGGTWDHLIGTGYGTASGTDATIIALGAAMPSAGTINGGSQATDTGAVTGWGVIGFALIGTTPSGPTTHYGATSSAYTLNRVTAAQRQTTSNLAMPVAFAAQVAGIGVTPGVTHYGALAAPFSFNAATAARRRTTSSTANPYTFAASSAGQRKTFGVTATPLTFSKAVAGSRKTFGQTALPVTFGAVTAGIGSTGAVTHYGQLTAPYAFAALTQGRRRTTSSTAMPVTFAAVIQTRRRTTSSLARPFTFAAVVASRKQYARTTAPFNFGATTQASKKTYGVVARPITFGAVTAGIGFTGAATYFGATATAITFSKAVQGSKRTFGVVARPITWAAVVQGKRTTKAQIAAVYTWSSTTQAKRRTHAQIAMPIQWLAVTRGISTVGIQTYYGRVLAPFTITITTKGIETTNVLNYAIDIRWGSVQADRVMVGTEEVWTP